jgi:hypothetical protein
MKLTGKWVMDQTDHHALMLFGDIALEFDEDGGLTYIIRRDGKQQIIFLRYYVDGHTLITDQPSHPRFERTTFSISDDGLLVLAFDGESLRFRLQEEN